MAQEITGWENAGLIDAGQAALLHRRYDPVPFRGALLLKWLGLFAVFMLALAFLGFVGTILASFSPLFSTLCLMAASYLILHLGAHLASERTQKHPFTGQALLTVGLVGLYASFSSIYLVSGGGRYGSVYGWFLLITAAAGFFAAYHFRLRWPLLIALLMFFHGMGSMSQYWGHGAYFLSIQDPRAMSAVALAAVGFGYWHEHKLETSRLRQCLGFGHLYLIFGLLYLNLSLWILSLDFYSARRQLLAWVLVFTCAGIAQVVAGARLKDSRYTGFGIVFLGIDLYTRFYEHFWDAMSRAAFFTLAGIAALALAYLFERRLKPEAPRP